MVVPKSPDKKITGDTIEIVEKFCFLEDVLCMNGKVYGLVVIRMRAG